MHRIEVAHLKIRAHSIEADQQHRRYRRRRQRQSKPVGKAQRPYRLKIADQIRNQDIGVVCHVSGFLDHMGQLLQAAMDVYFNERFALSGGL